MKIFLRILCTMVLSSPLLVRGQVATIGASPISVVDSLGKFIGVYYPNNPFDGGFGYTLLDLGDGRVTALNLTANGFRPIGVFVNYPSSDCSGTGYMSSSGDFWSVQTELGDGKRGAAGVLYVPKAQQPVTVVFNSSGFPGACTKISPLQSGYAVPFTTVNLSKLFLPPFYIATLPPPTFSPAPSTANQVAVKVSLRSATIGATIYYTTNSTTPTTSSAKYTGPIDAAQNTTIKAISVSSAGYTQSPVASAFYGIRSSGVLFTPAAGKYSSAQQVTLSGPNSSVPIYYTTDGSNPTTSSKLYSSTIPVSKTTTIKAFAMAQGFEPSLVALAIYTIGP